MYPDLIWDIHVEEDEKILYLTFDDGPHPIATPFVLDQLEKYDAKATFFCIGRNVVDHIDIYNRILDEDHEIGNHTFNHLNGWKTNDKRYIADILQAANVIDSNLFRPPYGRITRFQAKILTQFRTIANKSGYKIIMWSVLSGDWDNKIDGKKCYDNVLLNAKSGSIVVFHDSAKALERLQFALPKVLEYYKNEGYQFKVIPLG
jgi:peptidoglycan-N-acetylglucosamine deacetylase